MSGWGGDPFYSKVVRRWSNSGVGTNAGVSVTQTKLNTSSYASAAGIQYSGDAAAVVTIESPSGTILWRKRFTAAFDRSETFAPGTIVAAVAGQDILVKISASTANCEANIQGFDSLPGQ